MQTLPDVDAAQRLADCLRLTCARCAHTEFIHADRGPRHCLYSECACPSYTVAVPDPDTEVPKERPAHVSQLRERVKHGRGPRFADPQR